MMDYVDIETLFGSEEERTVENLSKIYTNKLQLQSVIHRLISNHFNASDIFGKSVLLKPNWVRHELKESDYVCLRTNDNLLLCVLEEVLKLGPSKVLVADAPVQACNWDKMITTTLINEVEGLSKKYNIPIVIKDFRRTVYDVINNQVSRDLHPISDYVIFDIGSKSYLETITTDDNKFRITRYNPDRMAELHHRGMHKYCIAKDVFDYDVIITIPKLKTHRMAGMTNALKVLVGINGDKDYLPHHRIGSVKEGGDNYKDKSLFRTIANYLTDAANRRTGTWLWGILIRMGALFWNLSRPDSATLENAGWYGNDTIWRTVMDINTIALYGDNKGNIHENQQRRLIVIMDGIVGGQGDGPLKPIPSPLGVVAISNNPYLMDVVSAELYHLESERIPLLKEAIKHIKSIDYSIHINSKNVSFDEVAQYGIDVAMSPGWVDYNKK